MKTDISMNYCYYNNRNVKKDFSTLQYFTKI